MTESRDRMIEQIKHGSAALKDKAKVRAAAMRLADMLSRIEIKKEATRIEGRYAVNDLLSQVQLADWPEIDVDPLLSPDDWYVMPDDGGAPACWPVDLACVMQMDGVLRLAMMRSVGAKNLRGKVRRFSPYNCEIRKIDIDKYGRVLSTGSGFFGRFGKSWLNLQTGGNISYFVDGDRVSEAPAIAIGMALRHRYEWSAVFLFPSGIKLRFGCSAEGALRLFNDREKSAELRRAALLHWVRRHWRRTSDPEISAAVKKHLRGITQIKWRGMSVSIVPAEYEVELAA